MKARIPFCPITYSKKKGSPKCRLPKGHKGIHLFHGPKLTARQAAAFVVNGSYSTVSPLLWPIGRILTNQKSYDKGFNGQQAYQRAMEDRQFALEKEVKDLRRKLLLEIPPPPPVAAPIPMILQCPGCGARHIDEGSFATKVHHTHACQTCGFVWRPAIVATTGVAFLPGFRNSDKSTN